MNFSELNLNDHVKRALEELKYQTPTPIQEKTIPLLLEGKDVLGCAKTGSGKTAAFSLPMLQRITPLNEGGVQGLVMTPTRELAMQIGENMSAFAKYTKHRVVAIYGGVSLEEQEMQLKNGANLVVATPGRFVDLMKKGILSLEQIEMLIFDEADRMLDMGFLDDILFITKKCPADCQKLMFSATMPKQTMRLADTIMKEAEIVIQDEVNHTVDTIGQFVYYVDEENKLALLTSLLKSEEVKKAIVFTNKRTTAEMVSKHLLKVGIRARAIHSEKNQNSRQDAILQFKNNRIKALVATDVAARGIDIDHLKYVYNYNVPEKEESYIHRVGRTGRAGEDGTAITFCSIDEMDDLKRIEAHIKKELPQLKSEWPMRIFQKKPKKQWITREAKRSKAAQAVDVTKVKDVSLSGKPVTKKSKYNSFQGGKRKGTNQSRRKKY